MVWKKSLPEIRAVSHTEYGWTGGNRHDAPLGATPTHTVWVTLTDGSTEVIGHYFSSEAADHAEAFHRPRFDVDSTTIEPHFDWRRRMIKKYLTRPCFCGMVFDAIRRDPSPNGEKCDYYIWSK